MSAQADYGKGRIWRKLWEGGMSGAVFSPLWAMVRSPSVKLLIASRFGDSAIYLRVRSGCPSLIIK